MKDLVCMHYYLGLEVWKKPGEIFLGQGKYVVNILQIFWMMDCKSMATPIVMNLKKLRDSNSTPIDTSMHQKLIVPLIYLVNIRSYICFSLLGGTET
jgi:hypothetical protein